MRCVGYRQAWEYLDGQIDRRRRCASAASPPRASSPSASSPGCAAPRPTRSTASSRMLSNGWRRVSHARSRPAPADVATLRRQRVERDVILAGAPRRIHRGVGRCHHAGRIVRVLGKERDADRCADRRIGNRRQRGVVQLVAQPLCEQPELTPVAMRSAWRARIRSSRGVRTGRLRAMRRGSGARFQSASRRPALAMQLADRRAAVDVDEQHADMRALTPRVRNRVGKPLGEDSAGSAIRSTDRGSTLRASARSRRCSRRSACSSAA